MKKTAFCKILSFILCLVLVAAIALTTVGCNGNNPSHTPSGSDASSADSTLIGQGATQFDVKITFKDGSQKTYTVKTDKTIVGDALQEIGLIKGTVGDYGLMVETVDGETVTYDADGKYWAFYIDGEYAMTGVDSTNIETGKTYSFKVE